MSPCSLRHGCSVAGVMVVLAIPLSGAWASSPSDTATRACHPHCFQLSSSARLGKLVEAEWQLGLAEETHHMGPPLIMRAGPRQGPSKYLCHAAVSAVGLVPHCTQPAVPRSRVAVRHDKTGEVMVVMDVPEAKDPVAGPDAMARRVAKGIAAQRRSRPPMSPGISQICRGGVDARAVEATIVGDSEPTSSSTLVLDSEQRLKMMRQSTVHHL